MSNTSWNDNSRNSTDESNVSGESLKICPVCNGQIPASAAFCPYCGNRFNVIQSGSKQNTELTENLSRQSSGQNSFQVDAASYEDRPEQNLSYEEMNPPVQIYSETEQKKKKAMIPAILAAVIAMLALAVVVFIMLNKPDPVEPKSDVAASADSSASTGTASVTVLEETATEAQEEAAEIVQEETENAVQAATPTNIPTATSTPLPTATPTPSPQPTINQVNIIDPSTGQLIYIPNDTPTSYAYPDSGTRVWSYSDVTGMTAGQVRYCINEIYARNGYTFSKEVWLTYFKQKTWYTPRIPAASFTNSNLSSIDLANVNLLNRYYSDMHYENYD